MINNLVIDYNIQNIDKNFENISLIISVISSLFINNNLLHYLHIYNNNYFIIYLQEFIKHNILDKFYKEKSIINNTLTRLHILISNIIEKISLNNLIKVLTFDNKNIIKIKLNDNLNNNLSNNLNNKFVLSNIIKKIYLDNHYEFIIFNIKKNINTCLDINKKIKINGDNIKYYYYFLSLICYCNYYYSIIYYDKSYYLIDITIIPSIIKIDIKSIKNKIMLEAKYIIYVKKYIY